MLLQRIVIDLFVFFVHAVMRDLIKFAGKICRMPMGEMPAVRKIHRQDFVARLNRGEINRHVGLRAAVRLHVHMFGSEQSLGPIDRELLRNIDILTAAIPAFARITFRVFVCQDAALRFHHRTAREIFRRNQFDIFALPLFFGADRIENFGINPAQTTTRASRRCRSTGFGLNLTR